MKSRSRLTRRTILSLPLAAAVMRGADIPRPAPALKVMRPGGAPAIDLSAYKGKVIGLLFLLTTCPHCKRFTQTMDKLSKELGKQGFQPLGVAINDPLGRLVSDFVTETGATFPVGYAQQAVANSFLQHPAMMTMYMPQLVIIDRAGTIRFQHGGTDPFYEDQESKLRAEVKSLLGPAMPATVAAKGKPKKSR